MKKYKEIFKNKYVILGISAILLMIIVQTSYAFFNFDLKGEKEISLGTKGFKFTYTETNSLSINNDAILSDANGKLSNNYFDFYVKFKDASNRNIDYYIYLEIDSSSTLSGEYVKVYLTNQTNTQILAPTTVADLANHGVVENSKYLYGTNIASSGSETVHDYRLRLWIDESITLGSSPSATTNGDEQSVEIPRQTYKFKVGVTTVEPEPELVFTAEECFTYTTDATGAKITGYKCFAGNTFSMPTITDIVIPNKFDGKNVVEINNGTYSNPTFKGITSVVFPNTLQTIGNYTFYNNVDLEYIEFANNSVLQTIGTYAFRNHKLKGTMTIPKNVETIDNYAFADSNSTLGFNLLFENGSKLKSLGSFVFQNSMK